MLKYLNVYSSNKISTSFSSLASSSTLVKPFNSASGLNIALSFLLIYNCATSLPLTLLIFLILNLTLSDLTSKS